MLPRYTVYKEIEFAASHFLREYHGKCERLHGHNYKVQVFVSADELDSEGMVVDFVELKALMLEIIDGRFDHRHINEIPPFDTLNPTAENLARYIAEEIGARLDDARMRVSECRVWETATSCAVYRR